METVEDRREKMDQDATKHREEMDSEVNQRRKKIDQQGTQSREEMDSEVPKGNE